jgi:hypothetical protein
VKSYNGFTPAQRNKAQGWLNAQWSSGSLARPAECCACGQTGGVIHAHAEDYSEPFAAGKTDEYHLCYRCHMMVHCRFSGAFAWQRYKRAINSGVRYAALRGGFPALKSQHLDAAPDWPEPEHVGPAPARRVLDEIA